MTVKPSRKLNDATDLVKKNNVELSGIVYK